MKKLSLLAMALFGAMSMYGTTVNMACTPAAFGAATPVPQTLNLQCAGFGLLPGNITITSLSFTHNRDYTEDTGALPGQDVTGLTYNLDAPGTGFDLTGINFTRVAPSSTTAIPFPASVNDYIAPFVVQFTVTSAAANITGATFSGNWTLEYQELPEPSTYAMIGGALVGLAYIRRRK